MYQFIFLSSLLSLYSFTANATVESIQINGLDRTEEEVILRELPYKKGDHIAESTSNLAKQKLYNLRLFSSVEHVVLNANNKQHVKIDIKERWTTIPILKFSNGGGITQYTIGAYDINLFGKYIEGGAQLQSRGPSKSGVVWYRNPRFMEKNLKLSIDLWNTKHVFRLYENSGETTELVHSYLQNEQRIATSLKYNFKDDIAAGILFSNHKNDYGNDLLSKNERAASNNQSLPRSETHNKYGVSIEYGIINYGPWSLEGQLLQTNFTNTQYMVEGKNSNRLSNEIYVDYKSYLKLPLSSTLAIQANYEKKSNPTDSDKIFIGGLDRVRGFLDNRFKGHTLNLANIEYRIPSYQSSAIVLQHIAFFDYANLTDKNLNNQDLRNEVSSIGTGLRIISPKIYRLVGRIDFAKSLKGDGKLPISFGVQQFF